MTVLAGLLVLSQTTPSNAPLVLQSEYSYSELLAVHSGIQSASAFRKWTSEDGKLELQIPSHWHVATREENLDSSAALEAIYGEPSSDRKSLISLRSSQSSHYAALNFSASPSGGLTQEALASATVDDLAPLAKEIKDMMQQKQGALGIQVISHENPRFVRIGRLRAFLIGYTYRRTGQAQQWTVHVISIPSKYALYQFVNTWNKEREPMVKPILDHVVQSLIIR